MCLACEEQEYFFRMWCAGFLARGEMPPGVTAEDLQALGLPLPTRSTGGAAQEPAQTQKQRPASAVDAFACDSPDE